MEKIDEYKRRRITMRAQKNQIISFILFIFVFSGVVFSLQQETEPKILQIDKKIKIDGNLDDWKGIKEFAINLTPQGKKIEQTPDINVSARFAFDQENFYAAIIALDDLFEFPDRSWRYGDGLILTFVDPYKGNESEKFCSFGFSLKNKKESRLLINRDGEFFPRMSINDVKAKIITDKSQKAVIYEIAIPWKYVIPFKPFIHNKWGINLIYIDRDGNQRTILQLYPDKNYDTESTNKRQGAIFDFINHTPSEHEFQSVLNASHFYDDQERVLTYAVNSPTEDPGWTLRYFLTSASGTISKEKEFTVKKGINLYTFDIESGDRSTNSYILSVAILDDKNSLKYTQDWSYFLINREEFNNLVSKIDKIKEGEQYSKDLVFKESLPTLEIRLEWIKKFMDEAPPFADTAFLKEWYEEMETLLKNVDEGKPALFPPGTIGRLAHRSNIDDTLQPYSVVIRPDYDPKDSYPLLVTLHGSGVDERNQIKGMARVHYMPAPKRRWANFIILAPKARGLSDWYLGNSGQDVIECIEHIKKLYNIDEKNIILDGFSMGGFGAWRLSATYPEVFKAVIIRSGAIRPPAVKGENILDLLDKKLDTEYFIVHGAEDNAVSVENARKAVEKLKELGIKHRYLELKNAGHGNYDKWDEMFDWLKKVMKIR